MENIALASRPVDTQTLNIKHEELPMVHGHVIFKEQHKDPQYKIIFQYLNENNRLKKVRLFKKLNKFHKKYAYNYVIYENTLYYKINPFNANPRLLLPPKLVNQTLQYYHNRIINLHEGTGLFYTNISSKFWFQGMRNAMFNIVKSCVTCQMVKKKALQNSLLCPLQTKYFNQHIQCDFKGPFESTHEGYIYSFTIIDLFTSYVMSIPTKNNAITDVIHALTKWFSIFNKPQIIGNDAGNGFKNEYYKKFLQRFGIKQNQGNPYKHESQGKVERIHKDINSFMKIWSVQNQANFIKAKENYTDDWTIVLSLFTLKHNNKININNGFTPNELDFGLNHNTEDMIPTLSNHMDDIKTIKNNYQYIKYIKQYQYYINKTAKYQLDIYQENMKQKFYRLNKGEYQLQVGKMVMINNDRRYQPFAGKRKFRTNNTPNYILLQLLPYKKAIIRNIYTQEIIKGIDIDRLIPYEPNNIINNELGNINTNRTFTFEQIENMSLQELEHILKIQGEENSNDKHTISDDEYVMEEYDEVVKEIRDESAILQNKRQKDIYTSINDLLYANVYNNDEEDSKREILQKEDDTSIESNERTIIPLLLPNLSKRFDNQSNNIPQLRYNLRSKFKGGDVMDN